ncbi:hypothetical protein ACFOZ5_08350 [Marinobacter lacisalsi]|uniref:RHS repeat-associated core domain-containing protein n=1 Tax=Marinobacter lacisalsi TaxID=475979 RepID=A0ABV8QFD0_9GAMM
MTTLLDGKAHQLAGLLKLITHLGMSPCIHSFNRYAYANNSPYRYKDPDGNVPVDTIWDIVNVAYDSGRIIYGKATGNDQIVAEATTDLAVDLAATLIPYVPAGSSKVARAGDAKNGTKSGAESAANAARLRGQLAGEEIAGGHAFQKHVLQNGEFAGLGIRTRRQFAEHISNVINNPTATRQLSGGRTAYWDDASSTVVIRNPRASDGGTAFQPKNGRKYFDNLR